MRDYPVGEPQPRHFRLTGALAAGTVVGAAGVVRELVTVKGSLRGRIRAKLATAAGSLSFAYVRPDDVGKFAEDGTNLYATGVPTTLVLSDTTEAVREIEFYGESYLLITYTDDSDGSEIDWIDVTLL